MLVPRVFLCLNRFARLASSELVEGTLNLIEGFETASNIACQCQNRGKEFL